MTGANSGNGGERLDSWKAIAAYLGRDEGTLRRWERTRGLPIRRVPGKKGASVYAYVSEIEAWLLADPPETGNGGAEETPTPAELAQPHDSGRALRRWARVAGSAAILLVVLAAWWLMRPAASADDLRLDLTEATVTARDAGGSALWVHSLGEDFRHIASEVSEHSRVVRGANPRAYVGTAIRFRRADNNVAGGRLRAFDLDGTPRWVFEFDDQLTIGGKPFGSPWGVVAFAVEESARARRIAVLAHHYTWSASLLTILDDEGRRHGTYVNDGWLEQLHWLTPDRLAIGGFLQSMNGGMVALIDPSALDGQSPETDPAHRCENCGSGQPLRMAVMPRTEVNLVTGSRFNRAMLEHVGDRLIARTVEMPALGQGVADAIYEFTPALDLVTASFSQRYWEVHDRLFAEKKLDHDRTTCPDKDGPRQIHLWSSEAGWQIVATR